MAKVSAIVLAAGLSRRMGKDNKMGLLFQGKPIVHHVIDQLKDSEAFELIIVTSEVSMGLFPERKVVLNEYYENGMTSSIQVGLQATSSETEGYMICLGDQPLIKTAYYNQIIKGFEENLRRDPNAIVIPSFEGQKGNPVIFSTSYHKAILSHPEPEGCKGIIQQNGTHVYRVELDSNSILRDIDTPSDYEQINLI